MARLLTQEDIEYFDLIVGGLEWDPVTSYDLATTALPANGGTVTGAGSYTAGSEVSLQATPNSGWSFAGWSGACSGTGSCSVTMDSSKTVTARFVQQQYTITASADPSNGGNVTGAGTFVAGSQVTLQATSNSGWSFAGWSGTCDGTGSCAVTMDSSKTVTAGFVQQQYSIIASANPSNGGSVTGVGNYTAGSEVSLQATPDSGWVFAGWSGACSGTGSCSVAMDSNKTVTASFTLIPKFGYIESIDARVTGLKFYESAFELVPYEQRVYSPSFAQTTTRCINWELNLAHPAPERRIDYTITAVYYRADGTVFARQTHSANVQPEWIVSWQTTGRGSDQAGNWPVGTYSVDLSVEGELEARGEFEVTGSVSFTQLRYTLTANANPSNGGSVTGGGTYVAGSRVTLQATPNSGWSFAGWSGACSGTGSCSVAMDSNKTVTASFTSLPPTPPPAALTITTFATGITDPTGITVDPNGNIYTINRVDGVVTMFDPAGNVIKTVTLGGVDLIDIYFDPHTGQLFVGGWVTQTIGNIYRFDINGGGSKSLIATVAGIGGITGDALGNIYAAQTDAAIVSKVTPSGNVTTYATGLDKPDGIAFGPDGKLYVGSRTGQVKVVPTGGGLAANFATLSPSIMDVGVDGDGNVYALNADLHTISKISPDGNVTLFVSGFSRPHGIVFDASGDMFISNMTGDMIHKVTGVG